MNKNMRYFSFFVSVVLCLAVTAFGQERFGSIEGTVKDTSGAVIPNATVLVVGNSFSRTVTSNEDGFFRVQQVPPGTNYTVTTSAGNFKPLTQNNITVNLGQATILDTPLTTQVSAQVTVTAGGIETIDTTTSKIQTNLSAERLETLPKGVGFASALKTAAPVRPEVTGGGFQIDGASGSENTFVIDGQEVTNFRDGTLNGNNNIPFQLVQEVQIKSNGFEAEFGGATGGVINVVTKRGSDDYHGAVGTAFDTSKLDAGPRRILAASTLTAPTASNRYIYPKRDSYVNTFPSLYFGGPIIKKHLNFFASHSPQFFPAERAYTFTDGVTTTYRQDVRRDYSFLRLDGRVSDKLQLNGTYLYNPVRFHGVIPSFQTLSSSGALVNPSTNAPGVTAQADLGGRIPGVNYTFEGIYTPTQNINFDVRYGRSYLNEKGGGYGIPNVVRYTCSQGGEATATQPAITGVNCTTGFNPVTNNSAVNKDISIRRTFDVAAGIFLNNFGGRHSFKFGYQYNGLSNDVDSGNVSTGVIDFSFRGTASDKNGVTRPTPAEIAAGAVGVGTLSRFGTFGKASSKNEGLFAQDSWQIGRRLTLNLGIRIERENVPSFTAGRPGIKFGFGSKIAPRIGAAYDVRGDGKWKVFGSYGRFFDRFKYELPRGSFGGEIFTQHDFVINNRNIFSYTPASIIASAINFTDFRTNANDPKDNRVQPNLRPFQQTEYTFGTAYDFGKGFILEGRFTHKQVDRAIEDIGFHTLDDDEDYYIGNPGFGVCAKPACGRYAIPGLTSEAKAIRRYNAVEVRVQKHIGQFALDASYTYSRLFGNYGGLAASDEAQRGGGAGRNSPNVNRNFDLPFIGFTANGKPDDGLLPTDRPHYVKFAGNYRFDWFGSKTNSTDLNFFYQIESGTPVTTRARIAFVSGQIVNGRGDLGRTNRFSQTDLGITHKYQFGKENRFGVAFDVTILNAFNQAIELSRRESITRLNIPTSVFGCPRAGAPADETPLRCIDRGFFNGQVTAAKILAYANGVTGTTTNKDQRYNLPQLFQDPRGVRFGFRFLF